MYRLILQKFYFTKVNIKQKGSADISTLPFLKQRRYS